MLKMYHSPLSVCSQKVRIVLAEKSIEWDSHIIDLFEGQQHSQEYRNLNPDGVVPTLIHGEHILCDSTLINEYLNEVFPEVSLMPDNSWGQYIVRDWVKTTSNEVHDACGVLSYAIAGRHMLLRRPLEQVHAMIEKMPDKANRSRRRSVVDHGLQAPEIADAIQAHVRLVDKMEQALAQSPWLGGDGFSLAEAAVFPYILRLDHLGLGGLLGREQRPHVADWYVRVRHRPSFRASFAEFVPEPMLEFFRGFSEKVWQELAPHAPMIIDQT